MKEKYVRSIAEEFQDDLITVEFKIVDSGHTGRKLSDEVYDLSWFAGRRKMEKKTQKEKKN